MQSRAASGIITSYLRPASPLWRLHGAKTHPQQAGAAGSTQTSAEVALPATSSAPRRAWHLRGAAAVPCMPSPPGCSRAARSRPEAPAPLPTHTCMSTAHQSRLGLKLTTWVHYLCMLFATSCVLPRSWTAGQTGQRCIMHNFVHLFVIC